MLTGVQMESELERFNKQNTQLELNITELRQKLKATDKEMHQERQRVSHATPFLAFSAGGDVAQLVERWTGMLLMQVRFPGVKWDFSPRVNFQSRLCLWKR